MQGDSENTEAVSTIIHVSYFILIGIKVASAMLPAYHHVVSLYAG